MHTTMPFLAALLASGAVLAGPLPAFAAVLVDDAQLVTSAGTGTGGTDESELQAALGLANFGFLQVAPSRRVADDFSVTDPLGWRLTRVTLFAYQEGSGTIASPITALNLRIWDGSPDQVGSVVVHGDTSTNRLSSSFFSGINRTPEATPTDTSRPIMAITVDFAPPLDLPPGTYWLDWQAAGEALLTGPWAPPRTIPGQASTGNGLTSPDNGATWVAALDGTLAAAPQGFPFIVEGQIQQSPEVPALGSLGLAALALVLGGFGVRRLSRSR